MKPDDVQSGLVKQYEIRQVELKKQAELAAVKNESANGDKKKNGKEAGQDEGQAEKKKITFLGTDITTKDIKIPGLNV